MTLRCHPTARDRLILRYLVRHLGISEGEVALAGIRLLYAAVARGLHPLPPSLPPPPPHRRRRRQRQARAPPALQTFGAYNAYWGPFIHAVQSEKMMRRRRKENAGQS